MKLPMLPTLERSLICLGLACLAQGAAAQPFSSAASSLSRYEETPYSPRTSCDALAGAELQDVIELHSESVRADSGTPAFCRVTGQIDPEITFEVDLPANWNGRFYMPGNGGHAGQRNDSPFQIAGRLAALQKGFAAATTNTGHNADKEPGATFVLSNPRKAIDYAYRAVHLTAVTSKAITNLYYGRPASYSYWNSCSNGGRQGLMEAQRYPEDFDGIVAVAPWVDQTGFAIGALWNHQAMDDANITPGKLQLLADSVMAKCDAIDGLADNLIDDPRLCQINVAEDVPACPIGTNNDSCLTPDQADAIQRVYDGPHDDRGRQLFPGFMPGSEALVNGPNGPSSPWLGLIVPPSPGAGTGDFNLGINTLQYLAFQPPRPDYDYRDFDFNTDTELFDRWSRLVDAKDINLREFRGRGGKLIMTYGWADQVLQPMMGVNYFEQAVTANGPDGENFMRLFMLPGMTHCAGGLGPDQNDAIGAVIDWVETGTAPDSIEARKIVDGEITRSRPLCPYPQVARYGGNGSINEAANFRCTAP